MWPDSKGKGGKEGSPKSKDGGGETTKPNAGASGASSGGKSGGKGRNTKTKMKAITVEGAPQQDPAQAAAKLEQDILKAAQNLSQSQGRAEETKTLIEINAVPPSTNAAAAGETAPSPNLMRLPQSVNENIDDKISSLWKSRVLGAYRANPRASQHILPAMPNNRGALEITEKAKCDAQQAAMITVIDKMFDSFQNLAFEFNNVAQASDLELTWIRPTISRENISSWHQAAQVISVFTGRISTRRWTMVVRGTLDSVLAHVIPADKLLAFTNQPANFPPVIELIPTADGLTVRWSVMGRNVSQEELGNIYRALLDNMIRIAQDDAPCDQFIDLAIYGVFLEGEASGGEPFNQPQPEVMGQDINYGARYQQEFFRDDATSTELPAAPSPPPAAFLPSVPNRGSSGNIANPFASPSSTTGLSAASGQMDQADSFSSSGVGSSSSADWKPVVREVRGANPPVPPTPMPGQSSISSTSATPGFNQDEPWKIASGPLPSGQINPSINSFNSRSGSGAGSFGGGPAGGGRLPGDQNDEPPLPSLPAHLFEGLPPRPQSLPSGGFSQSQSNSQASQTSYQGQPSPWAQPVQAASNSGVTSTSPSSTSSDDGWKSAGIPVTKQMQGLPPLPVSGYQSPKGSPFMNEPSPVSNTLVSPESFTSGSIRLDAIAREIAHSPVALPPAIPGFEPYSVDEPRREPARPAAVPPQPTAARMEPEFDDPDLDTWPEESTEDPTKPWPKARPRAIVTPDPEVGVEPQLAMEPQLAVEREIAPQVRADYQPRVEVQAKGQPPVKIDGSPEKNPFFSFESEGDVVASLEQDDPEIAALFEGEPVNTAESRDEAAKATRPPSSEPSYMAWLEPAPPEEEEVVSFDQLGSEKSQLQVGGLPPNDPGVEAKQGLDQGQNAAGFVQALAPPVESLLQEGHEQLIEQASGQPDQQPVAQYAEPAADGRVEQASAQYTNNATAQYAEPGSRLSEDESREKALEQQRPMTSEHSRTAIEEGFRMAQAALAAAQLEVMPALPVPSQEPTPHFEPAPPVVQGGSDLQALVSGAPNSSSPYAASPPASLSATGPATTVGAVQQAPGQRSLKADMESLMATLDVELETISARGSEAFARRDLKGAERMIKLAETLSDFKDSLTKLKEEHGQDLS